MKKLLTTIIGATLIPASVAFADVRNQDDNWFDNFVGKYYQDLDLTESQKTQIRDIHQKHRIAEQSEVEKVFTDVQKQKWEQLKKDRKAEYLEDVAEDVNETQ